MFIYTIVALHIIQWANGFSIDDSQCLPDTDLQDLPMNATTQGDNATRLCGSDGRWMTGSLDYINCFHGIQEKTKLLKEELGLFQEDMRPETNESKGNQGLNTADPFIVQIIASELLKCLDPKNEVANVHISQTYLHCPQIFDGWLCWPETPAGLVSSLPCPYFITGFDPDRIAQKVCQDDGTWFKHPETNKTWSNYTTCVDMDDLEMRRTINSIFICGYSISVAALVLSLIIFFNFRSLRCNRICIHKNLFVSFILNNFLWIIWYKEVVDKTEEIVLPNQTACQILHIAIQFSMLTSYLWMFCEGVYLHTLLVIAFVSEDRIMRWFYLVGWVAPAFIVGIYAFVRGSKPEETIHCWMNESNYMWILSAPVCASMIANLVFLINIVRVLVTKLRSNNIPPDSNGTRKAVKATLILIPLLGLHYALTPFRPNVGSVWEDVYHITSAVVSSTQGFFVSVLFCFMNSEVMLAIRKKWHQYKFIHDRKYSCSTACVFTANGQQLTPMVTQKPAHSPRVEPKEPISWDKMSPEQRYGAHLEREARISMQIQSFDPPNDVIVGSNNQSTWFLNDSQC